MDASGRKLGDSTTPEGSWADLIPPRDKPSVFFAFKHSPTLFQITEQMQRQLSSNDIVAIRLKDHPLPGTNLRERARSLIRSTDGTVLFWSDAARESQWVRDEYDTAKKFNRSVCLILFPGVAPPDDWNPDVEWVSLEGFTRQRLRLQSQVPTYNGPAVGGMVTNAGLFKGMMSKVKAFADYNHQLRNFRVLTFDARLLPQGRVKEVELRATVAGGTSPYTYTYSGLPPGLATANAARILGVSTSRGKFLITVSVRDAVGRESSASTSLMME